MINQILDIQICDSADEAPDYNGTDIKGATISKCFIVANGMQSGKCSVDIQLVDSDGNKFATMLGRNLVEMLHQTMQGVDARNTPKNQTKH